MNNKMNRQQRRALAAQVRKGEFEMTEDKSGRQGVKVQMPPPGQPPGPPPQNPLQVLALQLGELRNAVGAISNNQQELSRSLDDSDGQFCCLMRIFYTKMNEIIAGVNSVIQGYNSVNPPDEKDLDEVSTVDLQSLNRVFAEFDAFRRVPDFRMALGDWFSGVPIKTLLDEAGDRARQREAERVRMRQETEARRKAAEEAAAAAQPPAPPEAPAEAQPEAPAAPQADNNGHPEGAVIFGGDYEPNQGRDSEAEPQAAEVKGDAVPAGQDADTGVAGPG